MADSDEPIDIADVVELVTNPPRGDGSFNFRLTGDMTERAATTAIEVSRQRFAVPAEQKTKQEIEKTKRAYAAIVPGFILGGAALAIAAVRLKDEALAWVLVAVAGIFALGGAAPRIIEAIKKKRD